MPSVGQFIVSRREGWARLERLLARSEGNGLRSLSAAEIEALGAAYRQLMSDLAIARRDFPDDQLTAALNALAARAHLRLYRAPAGSWRRLGWFFTVEFARRLGAARGYVLVAATLLLLPAAWAYVSALHSATLRAALVPPALIAIMERGQTWTDLPPEVRPAMAALIFTNNIRVSFFAFAGGVLFGAGTVYALAANGLFIGGVLGAAQWYGVGPALGAFVSPHGYLELTLIVIAGAAGLMLGDALLRPELRRRRDALALAARQSLALALGAAPLFVLAGLIEGLVSPSGLPVEIKVALGPLVWGSVVAALWRMGRA